MVGWWLAACTPETSPVEVAPPTDVAWRLHDQFGTLVVVSWDQADAAPTHVQFSLDDGATWRASPTRARDPGTHEELLLGVPYASDVRFRVAVGDATSPEQVATTADPPPTLPDVVVHAYDPARTDPAPYVFTSLGNLSGQFWVLVLDREGRVVWAYRTPPGFGAIHPRVARDGRSLYVDHDSYWTSFDGGAASQILNMTLDGTVLYTFDTPGLHHPFTDLPDGSLAWAAAEAGYADETVRIARRDGTSELLFDCGGWREAQGIGGVCGSNTLTYHEPTDRFLFSLYSLETIIELDGGGTPTRWFGHAPGAWGFERPEDAFWWQHGGYVTDEGTLLTSCDLTDEGVETIVREYTFDEDAQELRQVWTFGAGEGVYGQYGGDAVRLAGGNTLHNYGQLARLREATPEGDVVWDIEWTTDYIGRAMPIDDLYTLVR